MKFNALSEIAYSFTHSLFPMYGITFESTMRGAIKGLWLEGIQL